MNGFDILRLLQQYEPSGRREMTIDGSGPSSENAVHRNPKRCSLPVHRSAAAYNEIGVPHEVQPIDYTLGD